MHEIHQSVARRVMLKVYLDTDHISPATGKTVAVVISKNGGAFANPSAGATNATELSGGWYYVDLSTTDTNTLGDLVVRGTEADSDPTERLFAVVAATNRGMTALPAAAADAAGGLPISDAGGLDLDAKIGALTFGTANRVNAQVYGAEADAITATAIANNAFTAAKFASGAFDAVWAVTARTLSAFGFAVNLHTDYDAAKTAAQPGDVPSAADIADAVWDEDLTGHVTADSAGDTLGNVATGTPPTAAAIADAVWDEATTGHTTSGTFGEQLKTDVDAILADTDELQSNQGNWLTATGFSTHSAADVVTAIGDGSSLTALAQSSIWTSTIAARIDVATSTRLASGDYTAPLTAAGTRTALGMASDNMDTQLGTLATSTALASLVTTVGVAGAGLTGIPKTGYKLASDGLALVVPADPSAIPVPGTSSIVTWIGYFGAWSLNEVSSTSSEVVLRNSADDADLATHAVSDDGTTFVSAGAS